MEGDKDILSIIDVKDFGFRWNNEIDVAMMKDEMAGVISIRSINKEAVLIEETEYEKYRENNIPTKNKLPQLPEEIVHKIMLMAYEIAPHPIATLIQFDKYRIHGEYYQEQIKDRKYYAIYLGGILGYSNESFYKWWFEKMAYRVKFRLCAEEMEEWWNEYKSQSV